MRLRTVALQRVTAVVCIGIGIGSVTAIPGPGQANSAAKTLAATAAHTDAAAYATTKTIIRTSVSSHTSLASGAGWLLGMGPEAVTALATWRITTYEPGPVTTFPA